MFERCINKSFQKNEKTFASQNFAVAKTDNVSMLKITMTMYVSMLKMTMTMTMTIYVSMLNIKTVASLIFNFYQDSRSNVSTR